ncbi:transglutaminase-like domain-containing protein [Streptomyces marispadix]|uniref:Transglutaminase-like domain-containing protein n=1 Tax=Streptomyces marispadix TaxID=2922868 RepID=A0ABS9T1R1_9ACTN|nr:transglutaminase-like domain-containing protein [Streptomyces marispadix]MCH6162383.1 transglutaminase-like domain-containing protein [Streptomyces marispadix]
MDERYDENEGGRSNRERFAEAAREERPDLALLCLLIAVEAATTPTGPVRRGPVRSASGEDAGQHDKEGAGQGGREGPDADADADAGATRGERELPPGGQEQTVLEAQIELDRLAGLLPYAPARTPEEWARALGRLLGRDEGFHGVPGDYRRLDSSLLPSVLRRRRGLPILLSVVWMEVARRAGAPVYGVGLPGHFVVGFGDPTGEHALADPYNGGRLLTSGDLELLVAGATGARVPLSAAMLHPSGPLEIVLRILNNIRAWAAARPEQSGVQLWALDLSLLLPHRPARLRQERARLLVERGDFRGGAAELEEYASAISAMEPAEAEKLRRAARAARARLN